MARHERACRSLRAQEAGVEATCDAREARREVTREQEEWGFRLLTSRRLKQVVKVANAPPGAQVASLDIDTVFRNIPVYSAHKKFLIIQCKSGRFYINHVVCFGMVSGVGLQGSMMDPLVDILNLRGFGPNAKWVDDLFNFRFPVGRCEASGAYIYGHDLGSILKILTPLGVPWSGEKWPVGGYATTGIYIGFLWDLELKRVSLPEGKHLKHLAKVEEFLEQATAKRVNYKTICSLNGSLTHIAFVYPQGRTFLGNLCAFIASLGPNPRVFTPRYPPKSF